MKTPPIPCFHDFTSPPPSLPPGLLAPCPAYVSSIAEGLAASIGGLDAALAGKAAHAVSALTVRHGDVFAHTVLTAILGAWARHERSPRLATPVMRCFDLLFTRGMFRAVAADAGFLERLLELARGEVRQCKDVVRLLAAAALMGHVLDAEHGPAAQRALQSLLVLLVNRCVRGWGNEELFLSNFSSRFAADFLQFCFGRMLADR